MSAPIVQDWLWVEVMLMQAMLGALSTNIRRVALSFRGGCWILAFTLEGDDAEDREEIADILDEFSVFLEGIKDNITSSAYIRAEVVVEVSTGKLECVSSDDTRVIFQRKE